MHVRAGLPACEGGGGDPALERWEGGARAKEAATLAAIDAWAAEGRLAAHLAGRLVTLDAPRKIDNADLFLFLAHSDCPPVVQLLAYPAEAGPGVVYKLRAHGGFDLNPLFTALRARFPESGFGGRSAAGGSKPMAPIDRGIMVALVEEAINAPPCPAREGEEKSPRDAP